MSSGPSSRNSSDSRPSHQHMSVVSTSWLLCSNISCECVGDCLWNNIEHRLALYGKSPFTINNSCQVQRMPVRYLVLKKETTYNLLTDPHTGHTHSGSVNKCVLLGTGCLNLHAQEPLCPYMVLSSYYVSTYSLVTQQLVSYSTIYRLELQCLLLKILYSCKINVRKYVKVGFTYRLKRSSGTGQ